MSEFLQVLDWDSEFFGIKVASIEKNIFGTGRGSSVLQKMKLEGIDLCYCYSDSPIDVDEFSEEFKIILVDEKVPLIKTLNRNAVTHPKIKVYDKNFPDDNLIKLALRAGEQSRFKVDPNIPNAKSDELFKIWIEKSVQKELATDVLVYREGTNIIGFITVQIKGGKPYASLLAVQKEYEGKGVSFALMNAVENMLTTKGFSHIYSSTQLSNKKALLIYSRQGLELQDPIFVYHIWKKK
ncbi:MAG: GNAT family N-acetyltransferase [Candidatus Bathyarchaeota archaeon]|nr:GNAT family N-acetyltransferase [Candidatus Bathyarchaeota archaeon]